MGRAGTRAGRAAAVAAAAALAVAGPLLLLLLLARPPLAAAGDSSKSGERARTRGRRPRVAGRGARGGGGGAAGGRGLHCDSPGGSCALSWHGCWAQVLLPGWGRWAAPSGARRVRAVGWKARSRPLICLEGWVRPHGHLGASQPSLPPPANAFRSGATVAPWEAEVERLRGPFWECES